MTPTMTPHLIRNTAMACAAAVALLTTGCHVSEPYPPTPSTTAAQALDQLESLPSLEETKTQVENVVAEIQDAAKRLLPALEWQSRNGESGANCMAPYEQTDGKSLYLPDEVATGADISEADWVTILAAAKASAAKLGATDEQIMQDGPSNHDVGFYGPAGTFIKIGYQGNLGISAFTGCRLPQDKKKPKS
jgi:hypothetical protein